jgi:hypothetical protein
MDLLSCDHGNLSRSCEICDLLSQLSEKDAKLERLREAVGWTLTVIEETAGMLTDEKQVYHDSRAAWIMLAAELRRRAGG